ncbi:MAB_1171c family putative transporter [Streptomyces zingiberis]|uniref:DUF6545 domain-containing protein n=1 Tax=Streptomyces zingiberis TaxID=2053010 RepID=A0ABX1C2J5_9ACTN|nr:MAB_1171c family putative transporter [Streptomyces zingiberis]NJQ01114.1 hypothetical protein [Streptomyces zingiberis]
MNSIRTLCFVIAALSSYAALGYRLIQVRRSWRDATYRTLITTLLLQCLTFTMGAVAMGSDSFLGVGNLAILLMHVTAVAFCVSAQIILLRWAAGAGEAVWRTRFWLIAGITLNALLVALFLVADGPARPAEDFNSGSGQPLVLTYLLFFVVSQAIPCVTIFRQCGRYARMTDNDALRQALRMLRVAAVVLFLYCSARTVNILTAASGIDIGVWQLASNIFSAAGIVILSLSLTVPSWGSPVAGMVDWARSYRSYRTLYPLWRDLYESSPDIVLEPSGAASVSDLDYRLHRRVIEIRDGWRDLRPYIDRAPGGAGGAAHRSADEPEHGVSEESRQAFAEAAQIRQALRAKRAGAVPDETGSAGATGDAGDTAEFQARGTDTFTAEIVWLTKVASAYRKLEKSG